MQVQRVHNNESAPWHPKYQKNQFTEISDFISDILNPHLDLYRSPIPSNEEMLIKNIPYLRNKEISAKKLKRIDDKEIEVLNTLVEKKIDVLRGLHSSQAIPLGVTVTLVTGAASLMKPYNPVISILTSSTLGFAVKLYWDRQLNHHETVEEYSEIRTTRLKEKIETIKNSILKKEKKKLTGQLQIKVEELVIAKFYLKQIENKYSRIYQNSKKHCDGCGYLPQKEMGDYYKEHKRGVDELTKNREKQQKERREDNLWDSN